MFKLPNAFFSALFTLLGILFCLKAQLMLSDTDFWWHIAAGDIIRSKNILPSFDSFSFTAGLYPWLNISWLWDVFYSWLNSISPLYLPVVFTALINALTLVILAGFLFRRGVGMVVILAVMLLGIPGFAYMLTPRPHEFTFLFATIFYVVCFNAAVNSRYRLLPVLPPLMVLWANIHGGFLVGLIILGAFFLQALLARQKKLPGLLFITIICSLVGSLLNPLGIELYAACARTFSSALLPIISEWQPLKFDGAHAAHLLYILVFLVTFQPKNKDVIVIEKALALLWLLAAILHERNLPIFILFSMPVLALNLQNYLQRMKIRFWLERKNKEYAADLSKPVPRRFAALLAAATLIFVLYGKSAAWLDLRLPTQPVDEAEFIKKNYPQQFFLNDYFQGGYLLYIWRGNPQLYIDGRAETAYPPEAVKDYLNFHYSRPGWEKMLDKWHINGVVLPYNNPNLEFFNKSAQWKKVYTGQMDIVFVRAQHG